MYNRRQDKKDNIMLRYLSGMRLQPRDVEAPMLLSNSSVSNWLWPAIIILSAIAAGLVNFVFIDTAVRPAIVFWFLFICPGMVLVRFLRLREPIVEWTLALALSFVIDAIVASILLYAGRWSPAGILITLMGLSLGSAIMQLATMVVVAGTKVMRGQTEEKVPLPEHLPLAFSLDQEVLDKEGAETESR
jgi:hypothetical protein